MNERRRTYNSGKTLWNPKQFQALIYEAYGDSNLYSIYVSTNYGETFKLSSKLDLTKYSTSSPYLSPGLLLSDSGDMIMRLTITGAASILLMSNDLGVNWNLLNTDDSTYNMAASSDLQHLFKVKDGGIYKFNYNNKSWELKQEILFNDLSHYPSQNVTVSRDGKYLMFSEIDTFCTYRTSNDYGNTWKEFTRSNDLGNPNDRSTMNPSNSKYQAFYGSSRLRIVKSSDYGAIFKETAVDGEGLTFFEKLLISDTGISYGRYGNFSLRKSSDLFDSGAGTEILNNTNDRSYLLDDFDISEDGRTITVLEHDSVHSNVIRIATSNDYGESFNTKANNTFSVNDDPINTVYLSADGKHQSILIEDSRAGFNEPIVTLLHSSDYGSNWTQSHRFTSNRTTAIMYKTN